LTLYFVYHIIAQTKFEDGFMEDTRLGQLLVADYRLTNEQISIALDFQVSNTQYHGKQLGEILISLGWLDQDTLERYLFHNV